MARAPLSGVYLRSRLRQRINTLGTCYVYLPGTTTEASVYIDSSSTSTITQPLTFNTSRDALPGWVDVGEYDLVAGGVTQPVEVIAGDTASATPLGIDSQVDGTLSACNMPWRDINSLACTTTSQTVKLVRVVPSAKLSVSKVVSMSGSTAVATITGTYVGLYTSDGTTLTRVGISTTNTSSGLWDSTNTRYAQAMSTSNILYPGQPYYVGMLVNATTAGTHQGFVKTGSVVNPSTGDQPPAMYTKASETSLASTYTISGLTAAFDLIPYVALIA